MMRLRSLMNSMNGVSVDKLLDKARPYFPDVNISEEDFDSVDWQQMQGQWYEVARTENDYQHECSGSVFCFKPQGNFGNCSNLCYTRTFYADGKVTKQSGGAAIPSTIVPFAISLRCGKKEANYNNIPNFFVIWTDYEHSIWVTPMGNVWVLSRSPHVSNEELSWVISHVPGEFLRCRFKRVHAKLPPTCCPKKQECK